MEEQALNETAACKIIGLTLETRPDMSSTCPRHVRDTPHRPHARDEAGHHRRGGAAAPPPARSPRSVVRLSTVLRCSHCSHPPRTHAVL